MGTKSKRKTERVRVTVIVDCSKWAGKATRKWEQRVNGRQKGLGLRL